MMEITNQLKIRMQSLFVCGGEETREFVTTQRNTKKHPMQINNQNHLAQHEQPISICYGFIATSHFLSRKMVL